MGKPYRPGVSSKRYQNLSPAKRDEVNKKVNKLFAERTGISGKLDPKRHKNLVAVWLRIRDEVMKGNVSRKPGAFLQLKGFVGSSKDPRHPGWIDLHSVGFASSAPSPSAQVVTRAPNTIKVAIDSRSSPDDAAFLMVALADGKFFSSGVVQVVSSDQVLSMKMSNVRLAAARGTRIITVSLDFTSIKYESD